MPFGVKIPKQDKIPGMDKPEYWAKKGELSGMLNWALAGLADLRSQPAGQFLIPESCQEASERLRVESNTAKCFLLDHYCRPSDDAEAFVIAQRVYEQFQSWCGTNGYRQC